MLIKIVAMFRNLLISSFDATIRVKRAFHPAPASRGFASHVFLVLSYSRVSVTLLFLYRCQPTMSAGHKAKYITSICKECYTFLLIYFLKGENDGQGSFSPLNFDLSLNSEYYVKMGKNVRGEEPAS